MKTLVTGASGFIGGHLVEALVARGDEVTCLVRRNSQRDHLPANVRFIEGDVTEPASLPAAIGDADVVYHLAGLTRGRNLSDLLRVNEVGVRNVAQACAERSRPPVLLVASSLAAAGPSNGRPREADDPPQPVSNYGRSKRAGELAACEFADRVPISIVRPPIVVGEGDRLTIGWFISIERLRLHLVPGFPAHRFSVVHVSDVCDVLIKAATHGRRINSAGATGEGYYFVARGNDPTMPELGRQIAAAMRKRAFVLSVPGPLLWTLAAMNEGISQVLRRVPAVGFDKIREAAAGSWTCSARMAEVELGFQPRQSFDEHLQQTVEWYRRHGWL